MTVPIYITAAILAVIVAYFSDRVGKRSPFIVPFLFMMLVGFIMYVNLGRRQLKLVTRLTPNIGASLARIPTLCMAASSSRHVPSTRLSRA